MLTTQTLPLCQPVSAIPASYVWIGAFVTWALAVLLILALVRGARQPRQYHWRVTDAEGNTARVIAPTADAAVAQVANNAFGMTATKLKLFLGQHIPDDDTPQ